MTRIKFKVLLVALAGLFGLATAELEFYQDVEPKINPEVSIERLVRYLEAKSHAAGLSHRQSPHELILHHPPPRRRQQQLPIISHTPKNLELQLNERKQERNSLHHQQHLIELARQKQRGLLRDDLPERPNIIDVLQRESADPLEYVRELERQRLLPYLEYEPVNRVKPYSIEDEARARLLPSQMNKDPMLDYPETHYVDLERARQLENARRVEESYRRRPEFTYAFDKPEPRDDNAPPPFAVGPNDPRFYEDSPFDRVPVPAQDDSFIPHSNIHHQRPSSNKMHHEHHGQRTSSSSSSAINSKITDEPISSTPIQLETKTPSPKKDNNNNNELNEMYLAKSSLADIGMLPEPQRRAEQDPLVVSLDHKVNNDIYFIAIVAGCSAAAMFALVLISLTWCRLQRVSKAAQDVEYPAYGVTGPNKDISPSGDQRLAQSAQMYHFQHQKQQIIAMEKASATRDPGSVSEAESDEENEEGDYTVYECPGLASTCEMEVKNPLFHDDPTPATPAKSKKDDDDDV